MKEMSYGRRLWYIWGPVVIKTLIAGVLAWLAAFALSAFSVIRATGGRADILMELSEDPSKLQELQAIVTEQIMQLEVPVGILAAVITIPILAFWFWSDRKKGRQTESVRKKVRLWQYMAIIAIAAAMCLGLNNLIVLADFSSMSQSYETVAEAFYKPPFLMQLIYLGILSPLCEELAFRGLMFRRIRSGSPFIYAAVYSSIVFAIIHGNIVQMLYAFALGMVFAYVYEKYGSLKAPCLAHMTANVLSVFATQYGWLDKIFEEPLWMGILTVACSTCAATMFVLIQRIDAGSFDPVKSEEDDRIESLMN